MIGGEDEEDAGVSVLPHLNVLETECLTCMGGGVSVHPSVFLASANPAAICLGGGPAGRYCCFSAAHTDIEFRGEENGGGVGAEQTVCIHKRRRIEQHHFHQLWGGKGGADTNPFFDELNRGAVLERPLPKLVRSVGEAADAVHRQFLWLCRANRSVADIAHRLASDRRIGVYPCLATVNAVVKSICSSSASSHWLPKNGATTTNALLDFVDELLLTCPSPYRGAGRASTAVDTTGGSTLRIGGGEAGAMTTIIESILPLPQSALSSAQQIFGTYGRTPLHISTVNLVLENLLFAQSFVAAANVALFYRTIAAEVSRNCGDCTIGHGGAARAGTQPVNDDADSQIAITTWCSIVDGLEDPCFFASDVTSVPSTHHDIGIPRQCRVELVEEIMSARKEDGGVEQTAILFFGERRIFRHVECLLEIDEVQKALEVMDNELFMPTGPPQASEHHCSMPVDCSTPAMLVSRVLSQLVQSVATHCESIMCGEGGEEGGDQTKEMLLAVLTRLMCFAQQRAARLSPASLRALIVRLVQSLVVGEADRCGGSSGVMKGVEEFVHCVLMHMLLQQSEEHGSSLVNESSIITSEAAAAALRLSADATFHIMDRLISSTVAQQSSVTPVAAVSLDALNRRFFVLASSSASTTSCVSFPLLLLALTRALEASLDMRELSPLSMASWAVVCCMYASLLYACPPAPSSGDMCELVTRAAALELISQCVATALRSGGSVPSNQRVASSGKQAPSFMASSSSEVSRQLGDLRLPIYSLMKAFKRATAAARLAVHHHDDANRTSADPPTPRWDQRADAAALCVMLDNKRGTTENVSKYFAQAAPFSKRLLQVSLEAPQSTPTQCTELQDYLSSTRCIPTSETYVVVADVSALQFIGTNAERRNAFAAMLAKYDATCGGRLVVPYQVLGSLNIREQRASDVGDADAGGDSTTASQTISWLGSLARTGCTWLTILPLSSCTCAEWCANVDDLEASVLADDLRDDDDDAALTACRLFRSTVKHSKVLFVTGSESTKELALKMQQRPVVLAGELMAKLIGSPVPMAQGERKAAC